MFLLVSSVLMGLLPALIVVVLGFIVMISSIYIDLYGSEINEFCSNRNIERPFAITFIILFLIPIWVFLYKLLKWLFYTVPKFLITNFINLFNSFKPVNNTNGNEPISNNTISDITVPSLPTIPTINPGVTFQRSFDAYPHDLTVDMERLREFRRSLTLQQEQQPPSDFSITTSIVIPKHTKVERPTSEDDNAGQDDKELNRNSSTYKTDTNDWI